MWPALLIGGGLLFLMTRSSSAATPAALSPQAQGYMSQIVQAQTAFNNGQMSMDQLTSILQGVMLSAQSNPTVSIPELNILHSASGQ